MPATHPPDPAAARAELARRQAALVRALGGGGTAPLPDGFDAAHVRRATASLARKRARLVRKMWPALTEAFGDRFDDQFAAYAATHAPPRRPEEDGFRFARWLRPARSFPDAARIELAAWQVTHGFPVRVVFRGAAGAPLLICRQPGGAAILRLGRRFRKTDDRRRRGASPVV